MSRPSLGKMLKDMECNTPECLAELERQASGKGQCAEKDLQLARDFFYQASTEFANAILAGIEPRALVLGNGHHDKLATVLQTYRWKEGYDIRNATHPYHGVWKPFQAWCDANDLQVHLICQRDASARERWYTLNVTPAEHLSMPLPGTHPPIGGG